MHAEDILNDQVIHVKRGRLNGLGFEPAFNSYFDFYASSKYIDPPLLQLEDIAFHLFLRKNLNDTNPRWKMPTIRQMKTRFRTGSHKLDAMMKRLDEAHLLKKVSGYREGETNTRNNYLLSDPIQMLSEFLIVASEGLFGMSLRSEWVCSQNENMDVPETRTPHVPEMRTDQQTLNPQQTDDSVEDKLWKSVLKQLQMQMPKDSYATFLADTIYQGITDGVAVITTSRSYAKDWLENRMSNQVKRVLAVELRMNGGEKIDSVRFDIA